MLLPIRRPVRPEPLPLNERTDAAAGRLSLIWINVRHKRNRAVTPLRAKTFLNLRGPSSSPREEF